MLLPASGKVGLEVSAEKTKYIVVFCHQKAGQNHNLVITNKSFENIWQRSGFGNNSNK
jgi:hypothetical protein